MVSTMVGNGSPLQKTFNLFDPPHVSLGAPVQAKLQFSSGAIILGYWSVESQSTMEI